ncbi:MAG: hypothetical protein QOE54_5779, partial [Streptosporangiaceae bacterium]|nr:hypothetical protein [Streptosporangiaceae bacterium]
MSTTTTRPTKAAPTDRPAKRPG